MILALVFPDPKSAMAACKLTSAKLGYPIGDDSMHCAPVWDGYALPAPKVPSYALVCATCVEIAQELQIGGELAKLDDLSQWAPVPIVENEREVGP